jgi:zinc protease
MVKFEKTVLPNGLPVIVNYDPSTPLVAMNILYKVGARNEDENKTGFAHLFEHLMFGGSVNIPSYDEPLQRAGGENNAFTNSDFTNYYLTIPAQNIETAFWLESDRMLSLAFSENSLEVQRNVVMEEFKQRYLNQPYGDVWLNLRPLAYKVHPYKWATIGKDLSHIEQATMADVKAFFRQWYCPNNAILTLSGNITVKKAVELANRWFGEIPKQHISEKIINAEPAQHEKRFLQLEKNIPADAIYKTFHACNRFDKDFYATELMVDILCGSNSSILYHSLVKEQKLFNTINVYFTGDIDNGLIVIEGKVNESVDIQTADRCN